MHLEICTAGWVCGGGGFVLVWGCASARRARVSHQACEPNPPSASACPGKKTAQPYTRNVFCNTTALLRHTGAHGSLRRGELSCAEADRPACALRASLHTCSLHSASGAQWQPSRDCDKYETTFRCQCLLQAVMGAIRPPALSRTGGCQQHAAEWWEPAAGRRYSRARCMFQSGMLCAAP